MGDSGRGDLFIFRRRGKLEMGQADLFQKIQEITAGRLSFRDSLAHYEKSIQVLERNSPALPFSLRWLLAYGHYSHCQRTLHEATISV
jgi:exonuclease VII small subunit